MSTLLYVLTPAEYAAVAEYGCTTEIARMFYVVRASVKYTMLKVGPESWQLDVTHAEDGDALAAPALIEGDVHAALATLTVTMVQWLRVA